MTTRVVHVRSPEWLATLRDQRVRIGRPSKWGNPFRIVAGGPTRAQVIERYRLFLRAHPELVAAARAELRGRVLGCYCVPDPCHGDVLAAVAEGAEP